METLIVIAVVGAFVAFFAFLIRHHRAWQEKQKRNVTRAADRARSLGWRFESQESGDIRWRMHGHSPGGKPWTLHYDLDAGSSSSNPRLVFTATGLPARGAELCTVHPKLGVALLSGAGRATIKFAGALVASFNKKHADNFTAFYHDAVQVEPRDPRLRKVVLFLCRDRTLCERVFDREVERLLLDWPKGSTPGISFAGHVELTYGSEGLVIKVAERDGALPVAEHLARLGGAIVDRLANRFQ